MKSKRFATALLAVGVTLGYSATSLAEVCYEASGSVTTENVTPTLQIGSINLDLVGQSGTVFSESGSLVGNITGSDGVFTTILSHTARFPQGDSFVTNNDVAVPDLQYVNPVRNLDANGQPCSYWITEYITEIAKGTRLFKNVTSVNIVAQGFISSCPGENENQFTLAGQICTE